MPMTLYEVWFDNDMTWVAAETPEAARSAVVEGPDEELAASPPEVKEADQARAEKITVADEDGNPTKSLWNHYLDAKDRSGLPLILATTDW